MNHAKHRFARGIDRNQRYGDEHLKTMAIEQLCNALPTGALVLDARGAVIFANREGLELLHRWLASRGEKTNIKASVRPALPSEIIAACDVLRQGRARDGESRIRPRFGGRMFVPHATSPNLSAVVALERCARDRRVAVFCVLIQDRLKDSLVAGRRDQLAMLTLAERRVAKLVADGLRNREIAAVLGKSTTTVKSQLGAIFSKLQIASRTQLATLLRSG